MWAAQSRGCGMRPCRVRTLVALLQIHLQSCSTVPLAVQSSLGRQIARRQVACDTVDQVSKLSARCPAGLMWDNMQGERWFERLPDTTGVGTPPDTPAARLQRHVTDWEVRPGTAVHACRLDRSSLVRNTEGLEKTTPVQTSVQRHDQGPRLS